MWQQKETPVLQMRVAVMTAVLVRDRACSCFTTWSRQQEGMESRGENEPHCVVRYALERRADDRMTIGQDEEARALSPNLV